jgi:molybdate transport system ATP-binding protein
VAAAGDRRTILDNMQSKQPSIRRKQVEQIRRIAAKHRPRTPSKSTALIEMRDASVTYDGVAVLKGINWTMREGENWAVLGPNGSGKTTLLSLILADNPQAYSNDISLFGRKRGSGESVWDIKKKIGWVSPEVQIHYQKTMTSYDVLCSGFFDSIGLYRECSARQESIARTWMRTLGLWRLADRKFDELSAGQQRMILIARASIKNPRLLILDEPCQGLDSVNRQIVLEAIDAVNCQARCNLIYVTHRLNEIPDSITHVLRLRRGHVVRKGDRVSVLRK